MTVQQSPRPTSAPWRRVTERLKTGGVIGLMCVSLLILVVGCGGGSLTPTGSSRAEHASDPSTWTRFTDRFSGPFDTITTVIAYAPSEAQFRTYFDAIRSRLEHYHRLFDIYDAYKGITNLKTVNDHAGQGPMKVDPEIIELLKQCVWANRVSDGNVNVCLGAVLALWHDAREDSLAHPERAHVPDMKALKAANEHSDIHKLVLDEAASTVELKDPLMRLDVGSGAKGFATEKTARYVEGLGLTSGVISVGGNVRVIGRRAGDGKPWMIGVKNPDTSSDQPVIEKLSVVETSVVTSGVYERYFDVNGKRYHHIIDPVTLFPKDTFDSVTIVTPSSALADALTTALFNLPLERGRALIESLDDCDALWVKGDERWMTSGFQRRLASQTATPSEAP